MIDEHPRSNASDVLIAAAGSVMPGPVSAFRAGIRAPSDDLTASLHWLKSLANVDRMAGATADEVVDDGAVVVVAAGPALTDAPQPLRRSTPKSKPPCSIVAPAGVPGDVLGDVEMLGDLPRLQCLT
ncbi:MAG: hypothetical protein ACR2MN_16605 [Acidimicrobiales bacterium]